MKTRGQGAYVSLGVRNDELEQGMSEAVDIVKDGADKIDQSLSASIAGLAGAAGAMLAIKALTYVFDEIAAKAKEAAEAIQKSSEALIQLGDELEKIRNKGGSPLERESRQLKTLTDIEGKRKKAIDDYYAALVRGDTVAAELALARSESIERDIPNLDAQLSLQRQIVAELQRQYELQFGTPAGPGNAEGATGFGRDAASGKALAKQIELEARASDQAWLAAKKYNDELVRKSRIVAGEEVGFALTPGEARGVQNAGYPMLGPGNDIGAGKFKYDSAMRRQAEDAQALADAGAAIGLAFMAIGGAIGGTTGDIVAQIAAIVVLTLKFIGLAIAASAASAAETPIVGPWAAIAGGVAVAAALFGLIAGLADGGPMQAGRPYLVGERGPELVVPGHNSTVIPNHQLGGGGVSVVFNAPVDASWWRQNERHIVRTLREATRGGRA